MFSVKKRLRKVEECQEKNNFSRPTFAGGFDIQALMERARDMRRRVIEDSEDEGEDGSSGEEDSWDSD
ncbi:hypothetical protein ACOMHN_008956 [Nucella lapillus]